MMSEEKALLRSLFQVYDRASEDYFQEGKGGSFAYGVMDKMEIDAPSICYGPQDRWEQIMSNREVVDSLFVLAALLEKAIDKINFFHEHVMKLDTDS